MKIKTYYFGDVEYTEEDVIHFEEGMYGFGGMKDFIIIYNPEDDLPFHWLQSIDDDRLSFIITSPFLFVDDYDFELTDKIVEKMDLREDSEVVVYCITVINDDIQTSTINLKAPIILNKRTKHGKQHIIEEDYPYKYLLFSKELTAKEGEE